MNIKPNTFAAACYDQNTIAELEQALIDGPDATDMANWGITAEEWTNEINSALVALRDDINE